MLTFSNMTITFQSATSSRTLTKIDLQNIFWRTQNLPKDIESITGFAQSIGGKKPVIQKTKDGSVSGDREKHLKRVEVRFKFKGLAVVRETNVTLSGSVPWEMLYRVLVRLVPEAKRLTFSVTNTAMRFYLKKHVRLESIANQGVIGNKGYTINFEPELGFSRLTMRFSNGVIANIFTNGTVVAQGRDLTGIEARIKNVLSKYNKPYGANITKKIIPARKNLAAKKMAMIESRYEPAKSWSNTRAGFYVRPGPNKVPRFYTLPKNPALVRTKVMRAYANIGVNVPNTVLQMLGIKNTRVKPKAVIKKTTSNWNANAPNGMYIRPGPGGLPKFYKIPKLVSQGRKTVIEAYKKAGVTIPKKVKNVFKIVNSAGGAPKTQLKTNIHKGIFRIDGLACMRYKLPELKKIATRLDIPTLRQTKTMLCAEIKKKTKPASVSNRRANFVKNGVSYVVLPDEKRILRNSRSRTMNSFKISNLKNMILAINNKSNVSGKKKTELINLLIERKMTMNAINTMFNNFSPSSSSASSSATSSSASSSASSIGTSPRREPLNIARNILGTNFSNAELRNFLEKYKKSPSRLNQIIAEFKQPKLKKLARANTEVL